MNNEELWLAMATAIAAAVCVGGVVWSVTAARKKKLAKKNAAFGTDWRALNAQFSVSRKLTDKFWILAEMCGRTLNLSVFTKDLLVEYISIGSPQGFTAAQFSGALVLGTAAFSFIGAPFLLVLPPLFVPLLPILGFGFSLGGIKFWLGNIRAQRIFAVSRTLPYIMDLLVMALRSGASFLMALEIIAANYRDHAIGEEFSIVLSNINRGTSIADALTLFKNRYATLPTVSQFTDDVITSQRFGNPLAEILEKSTNNIRALQIQSIHEQTGSAKVKILAPGVLILFGSLLILFGPFVVKFLRGMDGGGMPF